MNNLIIAAMTFIMLPALSNTTAAKSIKSNKMEKNSISNVKIDFTKNILKQDSFTYEKENNIVVNVDYVINEIGRPYITYINSNDVAGKQEVVRFLESATYNAPAQQGKIYSLQFVMNK